MPDYKDFRRRLLAALLLLLGSIGAVRAEPALKANDNGILEFEVTRPARTLVIMVSGDGGLWGDLDAQLAKRLSSEGYAVVGLDTRIWFAEERKAGEVAAKFADMMRAYTARTGATRVLLAGYSYGADVIPIAFNRLAPEYRTQVAALLLIVPTRQTMLQVTLAERTGFVTGDIPLAPEYAKLPAASVICIYGRDEAAEAGCTLPQLSGATLIELPGGHHFDNDNKALGDRVVAALKAKGLP